MKRKGTKHRNLVLIDFQESEMTLGWHPRLWQSEGREDASLWSPERRDGIVGQFSSGDGGVGRPTDAWS